MKTSKLIAICTLLALLLVPAAVFAQEQPAPEHGIIEFGVRGVTGEVYGRTQGTVPPYSNNFRPDLVNSPQNVYSDYRTAFYVPKLDARIDNLFGSKSYFRLQSADNGLAFSDGSSLTRNQSILATFGQYGHYKLQFRFDETPHLFSGTTRTLFRNGGRGVWTVDPNLQTTLFTTLQTNPAVAVIANALTNASTTAQYFTQEESRKTITGSLGFAITPSVNINALFSRENQVGTRPIGMAIGTSSTGYEVEVPESIDYYTNTIRVTSDFGRKNWDGLLGYQGSFFQNNIPTMIVSNPFSQSNTTTAGNVGPAKTQMPSYPDNHYQQLVAQGAASVGNYIHLMASVTPGFLRQNETFQPLTINPAINLTAPAGLPSFLPAQSLNGKVDTLAMNYTAVLKATKSLKFVAKYQHYSYDDNTPLLQVMPIVTDNFVNTTTVTTGSYVTPERSSFTTRVFDIGGTWFFTKKNSVKLGYQRGWVDRVNRESAESTEDSVYGALDMKLHKTVTLRVSGRHQNRVPQDYEAASGTYYTRMVDQAARVRNRGDVWLSWDPIQKLTVTGFWGTLQDNFNQRGGVNSTLPLGDASLSPILNGPISKPTPIYGPYYAYGVLNNIGRNYGVDVNYALTPKVVLFAEYAREHNTGVMVEGKGFDPTVVWGRTAPLAGQPACTRTFIPVTQRDASRTPGVVYSGDLTAPKNCDPINDLANFSKDVVNSYYAGVDITPSKKLDVSLYYSLSAGQSFLYADGVNCQVGSNGPNPSCGQSFANWKLDYLTSQGTTAQTVAQAAADVQRTFYAFGTPGAGGFGFPQVVSRSHEVGAIIRFKLTENLIPKFQYIYRQNDSNDWQTLVNPYSYLNNVVGAPSILSGSYAGVATEPLGSSALHKQLWLGADSGNPSYRAHIFSATLEYHF